MNITELKEHTETAAARAEYFGSLKKFCDGYLLKEAKATTDSVIVDTRTSLAIKGIKARAIQLIIEDALEVLSYNIKGEPGWNNKPEIP